MEILNISKNWVMKLSVLGTTGENLAKQFSLEAILTSAKVQSTSNDVMIAL